MDVPVVPHPAVVVLVGPSSSGKTTLRGALVRAGVDPGHVVSLDDLRRSARAAHVRSGREPRALQDYSLTAVRRAEAAQRALLEAGHGYVADATHLRRPSRIAHVVAADRAGLPAVALLTPAEPLDVLARRTEARPEDEQVPRYALAAQHHRRSLLSCELLRAEGFSLVAEVHPGAPLRLAPALVDLREGVRLLGARGPEGLPGTPGRPS
ncbi:AAA family ATPase [Vallicoccus soli]|uniref:AAA family ATPase n=1 Tax=Vallicoccus soli TaxID=2339232 RepID=UPI001402A087|nr:AAA family ATPase [Vallicoccus soli]